MNTEKKLIIEARILSDPEFRIKCLLKLYEKQEELEQDAGTTLIENGVGFTKGDSMYLSQLAQYLQVNPSASFTSGTMQSLKKYLPKYSTQLCNYLTEDEILN